MTTFNVVDALLRDLPFFSGADQRGKAVEGEAAVVPRLALPDDMWILGLHEKGVEGIH